MTASVSRRADAQTKIGSLQMLRFLAAALVMVGHFQIELRQAASAFVAPLFVFIPFDWGLGVDIFFVISGFVMYYLSHDKFGRAGASGDFMRRRLIRIVPLYWLFTTLALIFAILSGFQASDGPLYAPNVIASYLFLPGPRCGEYCFPLYSLGWTLNYEMLFYVLFAGGLFFRRSVGLSLILGALAVLFVTRYLVPDSMTMLRFWGYNMIGEFALGIGICHLFLRGVRLPSAATGLLLILAGVSAVFFYQTGAYHLIWRLITGGVPAALLVGAVVLGWQGNGTGRTARFLIHGGDASYALYLVHPFVMKVVAVAFVRLDLWSRLPLLYVPLCAIGAVLVSILMHHYLELPVTRWLVRRFAGRTPDVPTAQTLPGTLVREQST